MLTSPDDSAGWESRLVIAVQAIMNRPGLMNVARALGALGEHAAVWLVAASLGAAVDRRRREQWLHALADIAAAHASAVVVKRIVQRPRPAAVGLDLLVPTVSGLSFPSSHAASTTAAALSLGRLTGLPLAPALPVAMGAARVAVGAHYLTDVLGGAVIGWCVDRLAGRHRKAMR